jgi:hypothetical protein
LSQPLLHWNHLKNRPKAYRVWWHNLEWTVALAHRIKVCLNLTLSVLLANSHTKWSTLAKAGASKPSAPAKPKSIPQISSDEGEEF